MSDSQTVPGRMTALRSSACALAADDPAGLGRRVQRGGDEARGHEHEDHAGDAEEAREVQAHAAAVDPVAERDGQRRGRGRRRGPPAPDRSRR